MIRHPVNRQVIKLRLTEPFKQFGVGGNARVDHIVKLQRTLVLHIIYALAVLADAAYASDLIHADNADDRRRNRNNQKDS